jgi:hypothetical protein
MDFRVNVTIEVDAVANGLAIQTPVPIHIAHRKGKWYGQCESPFVETLSCRSLDEAIAETGKQVAHEIQASTIDRPVIAGRITPDMIPAGMF